MQAFQNIRTEMRESCTRLTSPAGGKGASPRIDRISRTKVEETDTSIEPWMEAAFHGLTHASETDEPFALIPCSMNGEPAVVIAIVHAQGSKLHVMPLFLACQPWMNFGGPDGDGGGGGGPRNTADGNPPAPR